MRLNTSGFDTWDGQILGSADDPRIGHFIARVPSDYPEEAIVAIAGFPVDDGVRINGGRVGAAHAPDDVRSTLYSMTPDSRSARQHASVLERTIDVGNLRTGRSLAEKQAALGSFVASCLSAGVVPVILGGGHETAYGHFLGYVDAGRPVNIVNVDAHADVRPLLGDQGHSGSPFRQALEHESARCQSYTVAGLQPGRNATAHMDFLERHGAEKIWADATTIEGLTSSLAPSEGGPVMLTIDLDAVDHSYAPGVSAPTVDGLEQQLVVDFALRAGAAPSVSSFDLVEANPLVDEGGRTVRLAAHIIWTFLLGFSQRS